MIHDDVRTLSLRRGAADVILGSPPCTSFSTANPAAAGLDDDRGALWWEFARLVGECRPAWGCAENSPAIRVRGVDRIIDAMEAIGYACWPLVVGADDVGAPHRRKRCWLAFADAERLQLRQQPRGRGGANGTDAAQPGEHGEKRDAADAARHGSSAEREKSYRFADGQGQPIGSNRTRRDAAEPSGGRCRPGIVDLLPRQPDAERHHKKRDVADLCQPRLALGQAPSAEQSAAQREHGDQPRLGSHDWSWEAALRGAEELHDGSADVLAASGAHYRAVIAAQGDAIVPQIAALICREMHAMMPTEGRVIELFAGAVGGWSYAAEAAGLTVVGMCEIDPWRREVWRLVHGGGRCD